jgi:hypothetical protein
VVKYVQDTTAYWRDLENQEISRSCIFKIVSSKRFEILSVVVILGNSIVLIHATDERMRRALLFEEGESGMEWTDLAEIGFISWYVFELFVKICGMGKYFIFGHECKWNILDVILVMMSVVDIVLTRTLKASFGDVSLLRVVRFLRVARILRMFRALRFINELRTMLDCILGSLFAMLWSVILIFFFLVMFSVFFVQTSTIYLNDTRESFTSFEVEGYRKKFSTVRAATVTLFMGVTGGEDWGEQYDMLNKTSLPSVLFIILVLFFHIAVLNIVTSVFLEKTMIYARPDSDRLMLQQNQQDIRDAKDLMALVLELDDEHTGQISFAEFKRFMDNERFRLYFEVRGIDIADAQMFFDLLVAGQTASGLEDIQQSKLTEGTVDFGTFVDGCFRLKGTASAMDLRCLDFTIKLMHANQERFFKFCSHQFGRIYDIIDPTRAHQPGTLHGRIDFQHHVRRSGTGATLKERSSREWSPGGSEEKSGTRIKTAKSG